ncbi:vegetative cell wall protein gp1-like [Miscanthus floridulus]|uniref:vegetative cell wall protein gp1-like n=1 Tax=Miscanthus floridulus TaxID=154761 RepID=UPI00345A75AD
MGWPGPARPASAGPAGPGLPPSSLLLPSPRPSADGSTSPPPPSSYGPAPPRPAQPQHTPTPGRTLTPPPTLSLPHRRTLLSLGSRPVPHLASSPLSLAPSLLHDSPAGCAAAGSSPPAATSQSPTSTPTRHRTPYRSRSWSRVGIATRSPQRLPAPLSLPHECTTRLPAGHRTLPTRLRGPQRRAANGGYRRLTAPHCRRRWPPPPHCHALLLLPMPPLHGSGLLIAHPPRI